jgi:hypothetical protein
MVTMMIGWGWIAMSLPCKGRKSASKLGCKTQLLVIQPIRSQAGRPLRATSFSWAPAPVSFDRMAYSHSEPGFGGKQSLIVPYPQAGMSVLLL